MREGNSIITDLYVKSTDTQQYLDASTCHVFILKNPFHTARHYV